MTRDGDHAAAADLLAQVVERVPAWAPGWAALAAARERSGEDGAARAAWERVSVLDRDDTLGAAPHLARLDGLSPPAVPVGYLRALFDDYAPRFERHLVETLAYCGPALVRDALERAAPGRVFDHALDLGCGTGLMGRALAGRARRIDGVDLSPAMLERTRATGVYADLAAVPLEEALARGTPAAHDLVVAADVLVYLGDLAPVFAGAARVLSPGGLLAFTVQTREGDDGYRLGPDMRFAHAPAYVAEALGRAGLARTVLEPGAARCDAGMPVPGLVVVATRR